MGKPFLSPRLCWNNYCCAVLPPNQFMCFSADTRFLWFHHPVVQQTGYQVSPRGFVYTVFGGQLTVFGDSLLYTPPLLTNQSSSLFIETSTTQASGDCPGKVGCTVNTRWLCSGHIKFYNISCKKWCKRACKLREGELDRGHGGGEYRGGRSYRKYREKKERRKKKAFDLIWILIKKTYGVGNWRR